MLWSVCGGVLLLALGIFVFLKPELVWKITEAWKFYRADEPSPFYLKAARFSGILYALFGIAMMVVPLFWNKPIGGKHETVLPFSEICD